MKRPLDPILAASMFCLAVALGSACTNPLSRLTASPPPGPPASVERPPPQKDSLKSPCPQQTCPETAPPRADSADAGQAAKAAKIPPAARAVTAKPSPVGPRLSALMARDELEKLVMSRVAFNAPEQMMAGVREKVEVQLAGNLAEDFAKSLKELGISNVDEIVGASFVEARLAGHGFDIAAWGRIEQPVAGGEGFGPWNWEVMPIQSGVQPLSLSVTVKIKMPSGGEERRDLAVFTRTVTVVSSPVYSTVRFVEIRWPWAIGILLTAALAAWILRRRRALR